MDTAEMVTAEIERLTTLLEEYGISDKRIKALSTIIENTAWMKNKLDNTREAIKSSSVVIPYDNGGGQKGIRENPLFKGYESLWRSYMAGMSKILESLPPEVIEQAEAEVEKPATMLELVRKKHKREA